MPWDVKKNDAGKFCVYKKDSDTPVKGGCHDSKESAQRHQRALYANAASESLSTLLPVVQFAEHLGVGSEVWLEAVPIDEWIHPLYGEINFSRERADRMIDNFKRDIRGQEVATDFEHGLDPAKGGKASGWIKDMKIDKASNTEMREEAVWWLVEFTDEAKAEIGDQQWRYFSPEWLDLWQHPHNETWYMDVATGGGLTNKPHIKGMLPINFTEVINEVADLEHSEPGTGTPPAPRESEETDDAKTGSRRNTPPIELEDSMEEFLKLFRELLKLPDDADDKAVIAAVTQLNKEIQPLREADAAARQRKTFAEQYPDEFARMQRLEASNRESEAKKFAEQFEQFIEEKDGEVVKTNKGFSALALEKIESLHKKFTEGTAQTTDVKEVLDAIAAGGIVEYGETGSRRDSNEEVESSDPKKAFSDKVTALQTEDSLTWDNAVKEAAKRFPEHYQKYREAVGSQRG